MKFNTIKGDGYTIEIIEMDSIIIAVVITGNQVQIKGFQTKQNLIDFIETLESQN